MSSSVSFRITRTAEDLAQTITTLSQRLLTLEQRVEAMELQLRQQRQDGQTVPEEERLMLDGIERMLRETRDLLSTETVSTESVSTETVEESWHGDGSSLDASPDCQDIAA